MRKEIGRAIAYGKNIFPVRIEGTFVLNDVYEFMLEDSQIVALPKPDENSEELKRLLDAVKTSVKSSDPPPDKKTEWSSAPAAKPAVHPVAIAGTLGADELTDDERVRETDKVLGSHTTARIYRKCAL